MNQLTIQNIPIIWQEPANKSERKLVIWLPGFTSRKEDMLPYLNDLALAGYIGLSFDPVDHGERSRYPTEGLTHEPEGSFVADVDGKLYRHFWSIEAETAVEVSTIIDWALDYFGGETAVGIGGISMGGDIALTAAGHDTRIRAVAACISTSDWRKPGSISEVTAPNEHIRAQFDQFSPHNNTDRYQHCPPDHLSAQWQ